MKKITVAIDGFSSTGKSTIAKQLAKQLGYVYVDTGAMYRAVALYALNKGYVGAKQTNLKAIIKSLPEIKMEFKFSKEAGFAEMYLNGENIEKEIRTLRVSNFVSQVSVIPEVRHKLVQLQKEMGKNKGIVMDGRDIGTVVFPEAELKLFMTASAEQRAMRRYKELLAKGENITYDQVLKNIQNRDYIDSHRKTSPLKKAEDAIEFDNSDMSLTEQFDRIYNFALRIINEKNTSQRS